MVRDRRVTYEVTIPWTKPGRDRFVAALLACDGAVDLGRRLQYGRGADVTCMVRLPPLYAVRFRDAAKPAHMKYLSPTRLEGSSLVAVYPSAEAELAALDAVAAAEAEARAQEAINRRVDDGEKAAS